MSSRRDTHVRSPDTARADLEAAARVRRAPRPATHPVQRLQRLVGNRAVGQVIDTLQAGPAASNGLPTGLRAGIANLSGMDLSGVRVHANSAEPARINALAYARGDDIYLAPGQERHLAHEAWHVVQQKQGRVPAERRVAGHHINDDPALEKEADAMGRLALLAPGSAHDDAGLARSAPTIAQPTGVVQRVIYNSVPLAKFSSAVQVVSGYQWKKGTSERTLQVWEIAASGVWNFHLTAMLDDSGNNVVKFHFTLRRGPGKGTDAFAWFNITGHDENATVSNRSDAGVVALFTNAQVPAAIAGEVAQIDTYAADIWAATLDFI